MDSLDDVAKWVQFHNAETESRRRDSKLDKEKLWEKVNSIDKQNSLLQQNIRFINRCLWFLVTTSIGTVISIGLIVFELIFR